METHKNIMGPREWINLAKDSVEMEDHHQVRGN